MKISSCFFDQCVQLVDIPDYLIVLGILVIAIIGYVIFTILAKLLHKDES